MPLLICILPVFTFAQNNIEQVLLEEIAETELRVTNEQRNRLENVKRNPIYKRSYETDMSSLPEGFYIVTTQTGKHTTSKKVLVQK